MPLDASTAASAARREREGVVLCVTSATFFATTMVLTKLAYDDGAQVTTMLAGRYTLAAIVLWAVALRLGVARVPNERTLLGWLSAGAVIYSAQTILVFTALDRLSASLVELLVFCYPALVALGAIALRRERASRRRLAAVGVASGGVILVLAGTGAGALEPTGALLAMLGAASYAGYVLIAAPLGERLHPLTLAAVTCTGAAVAGAVAGLATGSVPFEMPLAAWGWTAVIGLGSTVISVTAFLAGVARVGASRSSILATLEPPIAILLAFLIFGDRLAPIQLIGGAFVLAAIAILQLRRATAETPSPAETPATS